MSAGGHIPVVVVLDQLARYRWLIEYGRPLLETLDGHPCASSAVALPRLAHAWQTQLLKEQLQLRWRSRDRFPEIQRWLWTQRSLEQASDFDCARYKASLFPPGVPMVDACCGAGADLVALAERGEVVGLDADPLAQMLARSNARAHGFDVPVQCITVDAKMEVGQAWLHVDPDRRAGGSRTIRADQFSPHLLDVLHLASLAPACMIKLAPATRFSTEEQASIDRLAQRVWLSTRGECRQQLLLTGQLQDSMEQRTAVLCAVRTVASDPAVRADPHIFRAACSNEAAVTTWPADYVFDLQSVLHAADLSAAWAAQHGLSALGDTHGYYTGGTQLDSPWTQCFQVIDVLPWDDRRVRRWLRDRRVASIEVKCRLVKLDASHAQRQLQNALPLVNDGHRIWVLVTRLAGRIRAVMATRAADITASCYN